MAFYLIIFTRDHGRTVVGSYSTREEAQNALTEIVSRNLNNIEKADISLDVPPGTTV